MRIRAASMKIEMNNRTMASPHKPTVLRDSLEPNKKVLKLWHPVTAVVFIKKDICVYEQILR